MYASICTIAKVHKHAETHHFTVPANFFGSKLGGLNMKHKISSHIMYSAVQVPVYCRDETLLYVQYMHRWFILLKTIKPPIDETLFSEGIQGNAVALQTEHK